VHSAACFWDDLAVKRISAIGAAVLGLAILAACGGGGSSSTSVPTGPAPTATTPPPGTTPQSFSDSNAVAILAPAPGAATVPVQLPSDPSGASASAALSASATIPTDTTIASTYSTMADSSTPSLSRARRTAALHVRDDSGIKPIAYLKMTFSADVSLPQAPAFTFAVPGTFSTAGVTYWLALFDPLRAAAGWQFGFEGPATVTPPASTSGKPVTTFAFASNGQPITFSANQTYYLAVIAVQATASAPTPVPSSVPSNPPSTGRPAPVIATPPNVQFAAVSSSPVPVTFSQQGYTGTFTLNGDCTGIINTSGSSPTWTLTPVGQGRCVVIALGDRGATAVVHIGVVTQFETPHPTPSTTPTTSPTSSPSTGPTEQPSVSPSAHPSEPPSPHPSESPSPHPSESPTPVSSPTPKPSHSPEPTSTPTSSPATSPTPVATGTPTGNV
jgi:hypothetical protein